MRIVSNRYLTGDALLINPNLIFDLGLSGGYFVETIYRDEIINAILDDVREGSVYYAFFPERGCVRGADLEGFIVSDFQELMDASLGNSLLVRDDDMVLISFDGSDGVSFASDSKSHLSSLLKIDSFSMVLKSIYNSGNLLRGEEEGFYEHRLAVLGWCSLVSSKGVAI